HGLRTLPRGGGDPATGPLLRAPAGVAAGGQRGRGARAAAAAARSGARERPAGGVWAPQLPVEEGGLGLNTTGMCVVVGEAGYSPLGPLALHCAAPDEGNMHLLHRAANAEQQERYLRPLMRGEVRSCFAMTEPHPGAGSDPTMMRTVAERHGDGWRLNGVK